LQRGADAVGVAFICLYLRADKFKLLDTLPQDGGFRVSSFELARKLLQQLGFFRYGCF
jgi:hypothetical protein